MKFKFITYLWCLLTLTLLSCGRRSAPQPWPGTSVVSISGFNASQRDGKIRLSWSMETDIPSDPGKEQIVIVEETVKPHCLDCKPDNYRHYVIPFPSKHVHISGVGVYFYLPQLPMDAYVHIYTLFHQTDEGINLGLPVVTRFEGFVDFPIPPIPKIELIYSPILKDVSTFIIPGIPGSLENGLLYKFSWAPKVERAEFVLIQNTEMLKQEIFYKVNLYRTNEGSPWSEVPYKPGIEKPYVFLFQPQEDFSFSTSLDDIPIKVPFLHYFKSQNQNYLYQIRLVDSLGNESKPSPIIKLLRTHEPSLPKPQDFE